MSKWRGAALFHGDGGVEAEPGASDAGGAAERMDELRGGDV